MTLKEFFIPRFSNEEFQESKTRSGHKTEMTSMKPDNSLRGYPLFYFGYVLNGKVKIKYEWNRYGECSTYYPKARAQQYDLVRPGHEEVESLKMICLCLIGMILICLLSTII